VDLIRRTASRPPTSHPVGVAAPGPSCRGSNSPMDSLPSYPKTEADSASEGNLTKYLDTRRRELLIELSGPHPPKTETDGQLPVEMVPRMEQENVGHPPRCCRRGGCWIDLYGCSICGDFALEFSTAASPRPNPSAGAVHCDSISIAPSALRSRFSHHYRESLQAPKSKGRSPFRSRASELHLRIALH
jgi:hypothetical protein